MQECLKLLGCERTHGRQERNAMSGQNCSHRGFFNKSAFAAATRPPYSWTWQGICLRKREVSIGTILAAEQDSAQLRRAGAVSTRSFERSLSRDGRGDLLKDFDERKCPQGSCKDREQPSE
jgi:hypothetical protein